MNEYVLFVYVFFIALLFCLIGIFGRSFVNSTKGVQISLLEVLILNVSCCLAAETVFKFTLKDIGWVRAVVSVIIVCTCIALGFWRGVYIAGRVHVIHPASRVLLILAGILVLLGQIALLTAMFITLLGIVRFSVLKHYWWTWGFVALYIPGWLLERKVLRGH